MVVEDLKKAERKELCYPNVQAGWYSPQTSRCLLIRKNWMEDTN